MLKEGPVSFTDPGCESAAHVEEMWQATLAWMAGERWSQPRRMACRCSHWIGDAAEERVIAQGWQL
jgi:hypothetical protein